MLLWSFSRVCVFLNTHNRKYPKQESLDTKGERKDEKDWWKSILENIIVTFSWLISNDERERCICYTDRVQFNIIPFSSSSLVHVHQSLSFSLLSILLFLPDSWWDKHATLFSCKETTCREMPFRWMSRFSIALQQKITHLLLPHPHHQKDSFIHSWEREKRPDWMIDSSFCSFLNSLNWYNFGKLFDYLALSCQTSLSLTKRRWDDA